ncbi:protein YIPF1-like [Sycon ciliatum]|uniref:protein YIPF1-like n=1 Tax=Sycon ciliatum TaxID=27933 RepID=UPI0031F6321E
MMAESNDTVIDMDSEDSSSGDTANQSTAITGAIGDDTQGDDQEDVDEDEDDEEEALTESSHRPWSFEYYQGFFDVDTDQVLSRIWGSFIPKSSFLSVIGRKPDLYGPFWICMTLALSITISGNIAGLLETSGSSYTWRYDFRHLSFAVTAIYSYVWVVPGLLWAWLWWRGVQGKSATLFVLTCVYGYSLAVFVPSSILFTVPVKGLRWLFVMISMVLSGAVLFRTFWPLISKKDKKIAVPTVSAILILHAALSVGFVLYFFPAVPNARPASPSLYPMVNTTLKSSIAQGTIPSGVVPANALPKAIYAAAHDGSKVVATGKAGAKAAGGKAGTGQATGGVSSRKASAGGTGTSASSGSTTGSANTPVLNMADRTTRAKKP